MPPVLPPAPTHPPSALRPPLFLTAEWRHLLMANYPVEPETLTGFLPAGTELDFHHGRTFVSLVGFRFLQTRLLGGRIAVPWHRDFDEVNLRFYVRRLDPASGEWRRGVVFIKEIVPRLAIAAVARLRYRERYIAAPMRSQISEAAVAFSWRIAGQWNHLRAQLAAEPWVESAPGSEEEFISEHYWGYSDRAAGGRRTLEYAVEHPRWRVRAVRAFEAGLPGAEALYGAVLGRSLRSQKPSSVFLAEGSSVNVYRGVPLATA